MKFIHIADLHLGKYVPGYSMIENQDQVFWIDEFIKLVEQEKVDAVLMAGDIYDRSIAPKEAIKLFDYFVTSLVKLGVEVCIIAGNHDSGARLASMSSILKEHKVHIVGDITKEVEKVVFEDAYGKVNVYLVPYLFPVAVEQVLGGKYKDYNEAMKALWDSMEITEKNIVLQAMWRNKAISDTYEPGSTFKLLTASAALEEKIADTDISGAYSCSGGIEIASVRIKCWRYYRPHRGRKLKASFNEFL